MLDSGVAAAKLWKFYFAAAILDVIIELPSTAAGVHIYYGNQPNFFEHGLSVQIPFVMPAIVLVCGMMVYALLVRLPRALKGPSAMLSIPLASVGTLFAGSWPVMLVLNSGAATWIVWAAALISIALCLLIVYLGLRYFSSAS